ncbi:MAG: A/G-specific adenine glycosylase [Gammaproteobacteria bacterium]
MMPKDFHTRVLDWYVQHGRSDLPWQEDPTPYRVWISEIMLQQTQVATVVPYYLRFMARFPDVGALARASLDQVLHQWSGLGYYARARHLHAAAGIIAERFGGHFPVRFDDVLALPGIGKSTAGAILSLACAQRHPILDGNVKRVLARFHTIDGWTGHAPVQKVLWALAEQYTPHTRVDEYTQAMMDLGATVCTRSRPLCGECPLQMECRACTSGRQADYPAPRPRRDLPVRQTRMLLVRNSNNEVLLEKRPPAGIWGGLWSFPEMAVSDPVDAWCNRTMGIEVQGLEQWPVVRHTFSHFHLDITPVVVTAGKCVARIMEADDRLWYNTDCQAERGFAAPVDKLLKRLAQWRTE